MRNGKRAGAESTGVGPRDESGDPNVVSPTLPCQSGRDDVLVQDTTMNERHKLSLVSGQREEDAPASQHDRPHQNSLLTTSCDLGLKPRLR